MELISLRNFKSYENQLIANLNPRINVILGSNGQGKSNLFKAIAFALTDRTPLNPAQHNTHLHKALDPSSRPLGVQVFIRPKHQDDFLKLERAWPDEHTQELRVEGRLISKNDYEAIVESLGLSYSNPYNILQQGKVNQVTLMDDYDLYKLLEEATGVKKYEQRHTEALNHVQKNEEQKQQIKILLHQLQRRLQLYQSRKEQHEYYSFEEKATKVKSHAYYQRLMRQCRTEMEALTEKEGQSAQNLMKTKNTIKDINNELQIVLSALEVNNKQFYQYSDASTQEETFSSSQDIRDLQAKMKEISANKRSVLKKLEKTAKTTEKIKTDMKPYKQKHEMLTNLMSTQKITKQGKQELKVWLKRAKDNLKQVQSELSKATKLKSDFKVKGQDKRNEEQFKSKTQLLEQVNNELRANKIKYLEAARTKNQHQSEVEVFGKQLQLSYSHMRKLLPLLQFNLINQIRTRKISGVYGYLIEYLDIHPTVLFAYQSAGLSKLCTLLVENQSTVSSVVALNRELKGKQIQILPISFVNRSPAVKKNIPTIDDCYSLLNEEWVKIKPHPHGDNFTKTLHKILINTFGGHVLVKDYDLGLKVSKEYHLNCITADKQIVYSQGYLCKVGKDTNVDSRFQHYYKYTDKCNQLEESNKKLAESSKRTTVFQNQSIQLERKKGIITQQLNNIKLNLDIINEEKKTLRRFEEEQSKLLQKKTKLQTDISSKQDLLMNFDKKNFSKVDPKQYNQTLQKYQQMLEAYKKQSQNQCQYQNELADIRKQEEHLQSILKNASLDVSFRKDHSIDMLGEKEYKGGLKLEMEKLENQKKRLQMQLAQAQERLEVEQKQNYDLIGKLSLLQEQLSFCNNQLTQIGEIDLTLEQIEQKSNSFSLSMSRVQDRKKVRILTAAEKLIFSKMQSYYQRYKQALQKMKELEQVSVQINAMIDNFEKEKDKSVGIMFSNFQKHFGDIFRKVSGRGTTDVRLKKINERNRGFLKVKNSLTILVSFDEREATRKWSQFSGGQKTVVAVCMLMALQKCQPAPFYILDEADAALDPVYLQRISELIVRESQNAQYLISSFKRGMTSFSGEICNYYLVESRDRVSYVRRIDPEQAERTAQKLAEG